MKMFSNFIDRLKLPFRKDKAFLVSLHGILGFYPHNAEIYHVALTHKSHSYRTNQGKNLNNERLEFLGDAIIEAVVSDIVYHRYERKREGFLTNTRSKIVQRSSLNKIAKELQLDQLINYSYQTDAHNSNVGGNAFEALVGAIYLDRGYAACKWFLEKRILGQLLDIDGVAQQDVNFKSKLLEWSQKNRILVDYAIETIENEGSNHPVFKSNVIIEGILAGEGSGFSKKESQQKAAKDALMRLRTNQKFLDKVFGEKEKRTAMEAPEICAVPDVSESLESLEQPLSAPNETEEKASKPIRRANGRARRAPGKEEPVAVKKDDSEAGEKKNPNRVKPSSESETSKTRKRSPRKVSPKLPEMNKEDIICAAEEAAFGQESQT